MNIYKHPLKLTASVKAVITLFLQLPGEERVSHVIRRVAQLSDLQVKESLKNVMRDYGNRHRDIRKIFKEHFRNIEDQNLSDLGNLSVERQLLLGAFFTKEYSNQSAALFNPSIVPHPNQEGLKSGELRFVMSLRATGEGHISSIVFQTGVIGGNGSVHLDAQADTYTRLEKKDTGILDGGPDMDYELEGSNTIPLNEKVIFPSARGERMGMEDVRLVKFEAGGQYSYYGTYTAYDGKHITSKLLETKDFNEFKIRELHGNAVLDKGMALFPEKVNGQFAMISRQGGENISIMFSDDLYQWDKSEVIMEPRFIWELVQLGNCGSPIKTDRGWLLLTHGGGAMRAYVISAILLDLDDPRRIIGRLDKPIIAADESEREGYVPNVVYTCGFIRHGNLLVVPYALSDSSTGFITLALGDLLNEFKH
jgi:predicted GH43/DUF377 family glycosyl hydrolase